MRKIIPFLCVAFVIGCATMAFGAPLIVEYGIGDPLGDDDTADNFALDYSLLTITYEPINTPFLPASSVLAPASSVLSH